jgi:uncharacterized spore protein YtfJ
MSDENGDEIIMMDEPSDSAEAVHAVQDTLERFIDIADVHRVFGEPIRQGDVTILAAAEVVAGLGFGVGSGGGGKPSEEDGNGQGGGGGGGGGGSILSRPVAVIVVDPSGVRVEPIVDQTKIGLAALTAAGFILTTLFRMLRGSSVED